MRKDVQENASATRHVQQPDAPRPRKRMSNSERRALAKLQGHDAEPGNEPVVLPEQKRCAIFVYFTLVLDAPNKSEWYPPVPIIVTP